VPDEVERVTTLEYLDSVGRRVRIGSWEDQKISTYRKIIEAIGTGNWDFAAELAHYFVDEAAVCYGIYRQWIPDLKGFLRENGISTEELAEIEESILGKLALPEGDPWNASRQWHLVRTQAEALAASITRHEAEDSYAKLDGLKETWRRCHDRDVDHTYGLMSAIVARLGEAAIGRMWDKVIMPLFTWRYAKFDIDKHPWADSLDTLMLVACEAMRGHLAGPERTGDFELIETDDRFILRFDPCGSGGRIEVGDVIEGTPSRMEAPYNWTVSEEPHPWNHFQTGVCHYCTHCIRLMEEVPIDRFGYPVRVVDPPRYGVEGDDGKPLKCQWQMFKDPTAVPEEYYLRTGRKKPTTFGSGALGAPPLTEVTVAMPGDG
jgi:hypothetical protein